MIPRRICQVLGLALYFCPRELTIQVLKSLARRYSSMDCSFTSVPSIFIMVNSNGLHQFQPGMIPLL